MRVAIIGADRPWGARLAAELGAEFEVVALGAAETSDLANYRQVDLLQREALDPVLAGVEAIVHAAGGGPAGDDEQTLLDSAARGTYVALTAACAVGIEKVVLLSRLECRLLARLSSGSRHSAASRCRSLRAEQVSWRAHYACVCRARGPRSALLCLYAFSPAGSAARGTRARRPSLYDLVGGYRGGVFVWIAGVRDAVAIREFLYLRPAAARQVPARQGQAALGMGGQGSV